MISKDAFSCGVGGIVVSIAAFQAVDPGSIPGRRNILFLLYRFRQTWRTADQIRSHCVILIFLLLSV